MAKPIAAPPEGTGVRWISRKALNPSYEPSYSPCQTAQFLHPRCILASGFFSFLFTFVAADPRARGLAERRETSSLVCVAQVTRDATLARHGPSRATGRPASRRSAVALSAQDRLPARVMMAGPTRRLRAPLALLPGCGAGLFVSAVTSRGRRHIPLRLQDRLRTTPLMSGICAK